jgi:hypothetical protein
MMNSPTARRLPRRGQAGRNLRWMIAMTTGTATPDHGMNTLIAWHRTRKCAGVCITISTSVLTERGRRGVRTSISSPSNVRISFQASCRRCEAAVKQPQQAPQRVHFQAVDMQTAVVDACVPIPSSDCRKPVQTALKNKLVGNKALVPGGWRRLPRANLCQSGSPRVLFGRNPLKIQMLLSGH